MGNVRTYLLAPFLEAEDSNDEIRSAAKGVQCNAHSDSCLWAESLLPLVHESGFLLFCHPQILQPPTSREDIKTVIIPFLSMGQ